MVKFQIVTLSEVSCSLIYSRKISCSAGIWELLACSHCHFCVYLFLQFYVLPCMCTIMWYAVVKLIEALH
jgi:hypothetical protein